MNILKLLMSKYCNFNYEKKIMNLKKKIKNEKIKVVFIIRENSKWTYESVYQEMLNSNIFEPIVAVSILTNSAKGKDKSRAILEENYRFFQERGYNTVKIYDEDKKQYIKLENIAPDIIFYDEPYGLPSIHKITYCSQFALTCYASYSFELTSDNIGYYQNFHSLLWKYFVDCEENIQHFKKISDYKITNCIMTGYPKLDVYFNNKNSNDNYWKDSKKFKIIYAPHHSISDNSLRLATFKENGQFILNFAKNSENTTWIFKPHPNLKFELLNHSYMTESEIENYFNEWREIGNVYEQGDYFDIFKSSDLMITDCCSFRVEYIPTLKPLICPINPNNIGLNEIGKKIMEAHYETHNNEELKNTLDEIINNKNDYKYNNRVKVLNDVLKLDKPVAQKILLNIQELLGDV